MGAGKTKTSARFFKRALIVREVPEVMFRIFDRRPTTTISCGRPACPHKLA